MAADRSSLELTKTSSDEKPILALKVHQRALNAKAGNPFFLYLPINAPHTAIAPAPEWQGKSRLNPYGDFVMQVDWSVGQVLAALDQTVLAEDTLAGEICRRRPQHAGDCTVEQ